LSARGHDAMAATIHFFTPEVFAVATVIAQL
jgi:hypothetical protein